MPFVSQDVYCGYCSRYFSTNEESMVGNRWMCDVCRRGLRVCEWRDPYSGEGCTRPTTSTAMYGSFLIEDRDEYWCLVHATGWAHYCDCGMYAGRASDYGHECEYDYDDYDDGYGHAEIHDYSFRPAPIWHRAPGQDRGQKAYLGIEIETEAVACSLADGVDALRRYFDEDVFYLKHDGSIEHGFEMVSHPGTIEWWHSQEEALQGAMQAMRQQGMRSWNTYTCGIHIHVSKAAFDSDRHLWVFQQLFYRNADVLEEYAGRDTEEWGNLKVGKGYVGRAMAASRGGFGTDRYVACNLNPSRTVEIRIFRGSLNHKRVLANLDLVHAALEYSRGITFRQFRDGACEWAAFMDWALTNPNYPNIQHLVTFVRKNVRTEIAEDANA